MRGFILQGPIALTDAVVRAYKAQAGQRIVVYDAKVPGLCLRISPTSRTWSFVYRPRTGGKQRRITLGAFPILGLGAARERAAVLKLKVYDGGDPAGERKRDKSALTVAGLIERFVSRYAKAKLKSWRDYDALLKRDVVPALGARLAKELERTDVADMLDKIAARAPVVANRVQNTLSSVYSWAVSEGLVKVNPVTGLRKRTEEKAKERNLDDGEVRALWTATAKAAPATRDILRLIILTGQRPGECAGIRAEEIDLDALLWNLPAARVKNKTSHAVPLVGEALEIIKRLVAAGPQAGPLILSARGNEIGPQNLAKAMEALRKDVFTAPVTAHDLRRTSATLMGRLDIDQMTIARVLNHASTTKATVTGSTYDRHSYIPQKRRALEALDGEIGRIIRGDAVAANVTRLRK